MQAWIWTIIPSLFVCYAANRHQKHKMILSPFGRLAPFFERSTVLRSLSALRAFGFASLCKHNSPLRNASWAKHSQAEAMGYGGMGDGVWDMGWSMQCFFSQKYTAFYHDRGIFHTKIRFVTLATKIIKNNWDLFWWCCRTLHHPIKCLLSLTDASIDSHYHPLYLAYLW